MTPNTTLKLEACVTITTVARKIYKINKKCCTICMDSLLSVRGIDTTAPCKCNEQQGYKIKINFQATLCAVKPYLASFRISAQEMQWKRPAKLEAQHLQYLTFHLTDFRLGVCVVSDVDKVCNLRSIHLFILGCNPHRRNTDQLQTSLQHVLQLPTDMMFLMVQTLV